MWHECWYQMDWFQNVRYCWFHWNFTQISLKSLNKMVLFVYKRGKRKMADGLVWAARKDVVTKKIPLLLVSISVYTKYQTMKWTGNNNRKSHWVSLLSAKNRNLNLSWAEDHRNWTGENKKKKSLCLQLLCFGESIAFIDWDFYSWFTEIKPNVVFCCCNVNCSSSPLSAGLYAFHCCHMIG